MNDRLLYRAYRDADAYIADMYDVYRAIYDVPIFEYEETLTDETLFQYCRDRQYFILILPYTLRGYVLLTPTFYDSKWTWRIISGGVKSSFTEDFVDASERHVERLFPRVALGELEPIALLKNTFKFENQVHEHRGLFFIARVRDENEVSALEPRPQSHGHFVAIKGANLGQPDHQRMFDLAVPKIRKAMTLSSQEHEVSVNQKYRFRYKLHDHMFKPLTRIVGRFYGEPLRALEEKIDEMILAGDPGSILDIACGDNMSVVKLAQGKQIPLYVGNDISWSQIDLLRKRLHPNFLRDSPSFLLFTNHDSRRLPFKNEAFDSVICKNVLHHMPDRASVSSLISELRRVGRRSTIVEVLDPQYERGLWPKVKDHWYRHFLHDAGDNFLSEKEFDALTNYPDRSQISVLQTAKGIYQTCSFGVNAGPAPYS
jgi:hypothetical protein